MTVDTSAISTAELLARLEQAPTYELSQPFTSDMPQLPGLPRFTLSLLRRHGDTMRDAGYSSAHDLLITIGHSGTHLDAIGHVSVHGRLYGDLDADAVQIGPSGLKQLGIETVAPIIRRGVLADVAGHLGVSAVEPGFGIGGDLLEECLSADSVELHEGDVCLVRTGWGAFWNDPERYVSRDAGLPGVSGDGAAWLADHQVFAAGADCLMFEAFPLGSSALPAHSKLIAGAGVHLIENMNLESVAAAKLHTFVFIALPLRLVGATDGLKPGHRPTQRSRRGEPGPGRYESRAP
jgi:kynurenine formamidase